MRVIVLVDGDNLAPSFAPQVLASAQGLGHPEILRAYADASRQPDWGAAQGFRVIHAGSGKNAADVLLCLDAMEYLADPTPARFVLASSDGDFTHLALRLREKGRHVLGVGEGKAPMAFRAACTEFEVLAQSAPAKPKSAPIATTLHQHILAILREAGAEGLTLQLLGVRVSDRAGIKIKDTPYKTWRACLLGMGAGVQLDPKGPDARVRLTKPLQVVA